MLLAAMHNYAAGGRNNAAERPDNVNERRYCWTTSLTVSVGAEASN